MLEFKSKKLQIKFNDKVYELNFPTVKDLKEYTDKTNEKSGNEIELVTDLLDSLGLSKSVSNKMEINHLNAIVGELIKTKK